MNVAGVSELKDALDVLSTGFDKAAQRIVEKAGAIIGGQAKKEFRGSRQAPPSPPRPTLRTGNLRNSIEVREVRRESIGTWSSKVGPTVLYGRRVELGFSGTVRGYTTKKGVAVASHHQTTRPFPYMGPGFDKSRDRVVAMYNDEWARVVR